MFLQDNEPPDLKVLTVVVDHEGGERIVHVPVPAQAGYSQEVIDPIYFQELPAYNLPDKKYQNGTFRSFDVAGESMQPTLHEGDKVICRFLDPSEWMTGIRDQHVYVVVTRTQVLVKRVVNNIYKHRHLELISDNEFYRIMRVNIGDIRELWHIHAIISQFSHARPMVNTFEEDQISLDQLKQTVNKQSQLISQLNHTLSQMLTKNEAAH